MTFTITSGGGATADTVITTDASGTATTSWYLGPVISANNRISVIAASGSATANEPATFSAVATTPTPGQAYFGANQYMEYIPGDLPIVISAPHGGTLTPSAIPDRTSGTTVRDTNTEELAREIGDAFFALTGRRPHIIICRLRRTKLDANREIVEAAAGNRTAERAWYEYHAFITTAKTSVTSEYGEGLYMDLHGHGHAIPRLELGYLLTSTELQLSDATLSEASWPGETSLRELVSSSGTSLPQLLRGPFSLGALFESEGYPAVPSPSQPHPGNDPYFNGGYNTDRHGSRNGGSISGFQLEAHFAGVRDTPQSREQFAIALVDIFDEYLARHFGIDITP